MNSKILITAATLFFWPNMTIASENDGFCSTVEAFAKGIMIQRQNGGSFSEMMTKARTGDSWEGLLVAITRQTFDQPRFYTDEMIDRASTDFANEWAADCYRARTTPAARKPGPRKRKAK